MYTWDELYSIGVGEKPDIFGSVLLYADVLAGKGASGQHSQSGLRRNKAHVLPSCKALASCPEGFFPQGLIADNTFEV